MAALEVDAPSFSDSGEEFSSDSEAEGAVGMFRLTSKIIKVQRLMGYKLLSYEHIALQLSEHSECLIT